MDFEVFRGPLVTALRRSARGKGDRLPFDPILMFKILILKALYSLSDEATEFQRADSLIGAPYASADELYGGEVVCGILVVSGCYAPELF